MFMVDLDWVKSSWLRGGRTNTGVLHFVQDDNSTCVRGDVEVDLEAVVGEADVGRQHGVGGGVVEIVGHVGEEGAAGADLFYDGNGFFEMRVGRVRLAGGGGGGEGGEGGGGGEGLGGGV